MDWFSILKDSNFGFFSDKPNAGFSERDRRKDWVNLSGVNRTGVDALNRLNRLKGSSPELQSDEYKEKLNALSDEVEEEVINEIVDVAIHESAHRAASDIQNYNNLKDETITTMNDYLTKISTEVFEGMPISPIQPVLIEVAKFAQWQVLDEVYAMMTERTRVEKPETFEYSVKELIINDYIPKYTESFENIVNYLVTGWIEGLAELNKNLESNALNQVNSKLKETGESFKQGFRGSLIVSANKIKR